VGNRFPLYLSFVGSKARLLIISFLQSFPKVFFVSNVLLFNISNEFMV